MSYKAFPCTGFWTFPREIRETKFASDEVAKLLTALENSLVEVSTAPNFAHRSAGTVDDHHQAQQVDCDPIDRREDIDEMEDFLMVEADTDARSGPDVSLNDEEDETEYLEARRNEADTVGNDRANVPWWSGIWRS